MKKIIFIASISVLCMCLHAMDKETEKTPLVKPPQNSMVFPRFPASSRLSRDSSQCCDEYCCCCLLPIYYAFVRCVMPAQPLAKYCSEQD